MYSDEYDKRSRRVLSENELALHSAFHNETRRRDTRLGSGGFCEVFISLSLSLLMSKSVDNLPIKIP